VPPRDHAALHATLAELIRSETACLELGQAARLRAMRYSASRMGFAYLSLYRQLAASRRHGASNADLARLAS